MRKIRDTLLIITLLGILIWRWAAPGLRNSGSAGVHSIAVMNFGCLKPSFVVIFSRIGAPNFGSIGRSA